MTIHPRTPFPIEGIDPGDMATFLVDALVTIRTRNDLADLCTLLTTTLVDILPFSGAAVVLSGGAHEPVVASATGGSSVVRRALEDHVDGEPVRRCLETGLPATGVGSSPNEGQQLHVLPIAAHDTVLGALLVVADGSLAREHLDAAGIFVDVAAVAFLQAGPHLVSASSQSCFADLLRSLDTIEQAKGMLSQRHAVGVDTAFDGLWQVALDHGVGLSALAEQVVNRTLDESMLRALSSNFTNRVSAPTE